MPAPGFRGSPPNVRLWRKAGVPPWVAPAPVLSKRAETALGQYPGTGATRFPGDQLMHSAMRYHSVR